MVLQRTLPLGSLPLLGGAATILGLLACDGGANTGGVGGGGGAGGSGPPPALIDLVVDANRDGVASVADASDANDDVWDTTTGASFLPNIDDDDGDELRDCDEELPPVGEDEKDLAPVLVKAWPEAPDGATATLTLDEKSGDAVRIWRKGADGAYSLVLGATGCDQQEKLPLTEAEYNADSICTPALSLSLSTDDLRAGVTFGLEGRYFRKSLSDSAWNGQVQLTLAVVDAEGAPIEAEGAPGGVDTAALHVAPWILNGNLSKYTGLNFYGDKTEQVFGVPGAFQFKEFSEQLEDFASGLSAESITHDASPNNWPDQWTQDWMQTGWVGVPGPGGTMHGMTVYNPRPWGRSAGLTQLPIYNLRRNYLAPGVGVYETYKLPIPADGYGDSYDSHGNHDLLPPYENGDQKFPLGRIIIGSGVIKDTRDFYKAQEYQTPLAVDTSWLIVGHVDEAITYAPANTPRGWKLLVARPSLAKQLLEELSAAGHGDVPFFEGRKKYAGNSVVDAAETIDEILADQNLMKWSQDSEAFIDAMVDDVVAAVGLTPDEIVYMPMLYEAENYGEWLHVSFDPGTVNMLIMGDSMAIPKPFAAQVNGVDVWEDYLNGEFTTSKNALGADGQGMNVAYIDNWYGYHILLGEVHCGSNPVAPPDPEMTWWSDAKPVVP
jgi:protein-arginine deiminase